MIFVALFLGYACYSYNRKSVTFALPALTAEGLSKEQAVVPSFFLRNVIRYPGCLVQHLPEPCASARLFPDPELRLAC
ncbi:hypothetical protein IscW_ISCW014152 [Ixodes scapularis]|uniref:Uncharacterized protein n=1 Tax=Ixodes scapularis TaxID=6945 RepID=B7QL75_IXOSC|nr:hypothetical protein IscW_ISCW014152 [Ixodes scapularis]|eukprot:XP_002415930.1 hypothetical protein IscW_ISCW014152 [Ixodes scapularis]